MGQTYVPVDAAPAANGIMPLANSSGSIETGGAWLHWTDSGFTGRGWFWEDPYNEVQAGWAAAVVKDNGYVNGCGGEADGTPHKESYESFLYHVSQRHTENLDYILGGWDTKTKMQFILAHPELESSDCVVWQ